MKDIIFKVAGHPEEELIFYPFSSCGDINDGVGFVNGRYSGGWVIAYKDLLQMVKLAEQARRPTPRAADSARAARLARQKKAKSKKVAPAKSG